MTPTGNGLSSRSVLRSHTYIHVFIKTFCRQIHTVNSVSWSGSHHHHLTLRFTVSSTFPSPVQCVLNISLSDSCCVISHSVSMIFYLYFSMSIMSLSVCHCPWYVFISKSLCISCLYWYLTLLDNQGCAHETGCDNKLYQIIICLFITLVQMSHHLSLWCVRNCDSQSTKH